MPTLKFGPEPKSTAERVKAYRQRQAVRGARIVSVTLDAETVTMLDDLVESRGHRKGGGNTGAIKAAIRHLHSVSL